MKRKISRFVPILMIALVGILSTGCMPMVYDDNPHFSHHRNPPKPRPIPAPAPRPGNQGPGYNPGKPGPDRPAPAPAKPQPTPGRPGTNNHR